MDKKSKKRPVTLIEIMIVILLIGLIGGALAFNMRGSIDKGRAFKTEQNIARVKDVLMMEHAKGEKTLPLIAQDWDSIVAKCPLFKNSKALTKDAWGVKLNVQFNEKTDDIEIWSEKLQVWKSKHE